MAFNPKDYVNKESFTQTPITFTIIYIDDVTKSKLSKLDEWKKIKDPSQISVDRLNHGKLISEIADDSQPPAPSTTESIYKLTLKDEQDNYCFGYEYNDKLSFLRTGSSCPIPIKLGGKLVVKKGTLVTNGCLMLKAAQVEYLGVGGGDLVKELNSNLVEKSIEILTKEL